mgnify:CR=1 FL=1
MTRTVHAVTGAFGYSGLHLARVLLARGERVRNLTGHPDRTDPFGGAVEVTRFRFEDREAMRKGWMAARAAALGKAGFDTIFD